MRNGTVAEDDLSVRFYTFTELRDLLLEVGFAAVRSSATTASRSRSRAGG